MRYYRLVDLETRKALYNRCRPDEALSPGDERWVDLDALGLRGAGLADMLASAFELSAQPECRFVTCVPGTGMTTELLRLASRLRSPDGANLLPVHVDARDVIDLSQPITAVDMLVSIVERADRTVRDVCGESVRNEPGYYFCWLMDETSSLAPAAYLELLAKNPEARKDLHRRLELRQSSFVEKTFDELFLIDERARRAGYRGIVVFFDSMERHWGLSTNMKSVHESAERVYVQNAAMLELPIHVVYTAPPTLLARNPRMVMDVLPALTMHHPDGRVIDSAVSAARAIAERRIHAPVLRTLFGEENLAGLDRMNVRTGGRLFEMVRALRLMVARFGTPHALEHVLADINEDAQRFVSSQGQRILNEIAQTGRLATDESAELLTTERLIAAGMILPYAQADGSLWFGVAPHADGIDVKT